MDSMAAEAVASRSFLTADELLAGSTLSFEIDVPTVLLDPAAGGARSGVAGRVRLRPLTVTDLQLLSRAARDNDSLVGALMVKTALDEPRLTLAQVNAMPIGLLEFLLAEVNRVSGLSLPAGALDSAAEQPIARAAHVLARQFGWTPQQIGAMTLGQILLHLQMLRDAGADDA
jgi:hypothetical protein